MPLPKQNHHGTCVSEQYEPTSPNPRDATQQKIYAYMGRMRRRVCSHRSPEDPTRVGCPLLFVSVFPLREAYLR